MRVFRWEAPGGKAKGGKKYRAGQALHDPPGRPVPWSEEGGDGAQVAYTYLGQGTWGQGEVWVRQGDQWVRQRTRQVWRRRTVTTSRI